jgi:dUTPase
MRRAPPVAASLTPFAGLRAWYERVAAFGHGESEPLSSSAAIGLARDAAGHAPCAVAPGAGIEAGTLVGVVPADYAHDEVVGTLVGLDDDESVVERSDERAGTVHVHFPRIGFHVKAQPPKKEGP